MDVQLDIQEYGLKTDKELVSLLKISLFLKLPFDKNLTPNNPWICLSSSFPEVTCQPGGNSVN